MRVLQRTLSGVALLAIATGVRPEDSVPSTAISAEGPSVSSPTPVEASKLRGFRSAFTDTVLGNFGARQVAASAPAVEAPATEEEETATPVASTTAIAETEDEDFMAAAPDAPFLAWLSACTAFVAQLFPTDLLVMPDSSDLGGNLRGFVAVTFDEYDQDVEVEFMEDAEIDVIFTMSADEDMEIMGAPMEAISALAAEVEMEAMLEEEAETASLADFVASLDLNPESLKVVTGDAEDVEDVEDADRPEYFMEDEEVEREPDNMYEILDSDGAEAPIYSAPVGDAEPTGVYESMLEEAARDEDLYPYSDYAVEKPVSLTEGSPAKLAGTLEDLLVEKRIVDAAVIDLVQQTEDLDRDESLDGDVKLLEQDFLDSAVAQMMEQEVSLADAIDEVEDALLATTFSVVQSAEEALPLPSIVSAQVPRLVKGLEGKTA